MAGLGSAGLRRARGGWELSYGRVFVWSFALGEEVVVDEVSLFSFAGSGGQVVGLVVLVGERCDGDGRVI